MPESTIMEKIVSLCKRRGFIYPASEIYGGINGFWDYGPLGVLLKNNIRDSWWRHMVECPPLGPDGHPVDLVGLDSSIIQNPKTWIASGHVGGFSDPMVDDRETKSRYRADHLMCAPARVKRKSGELQELGWLSVLSGDDAIDNFVKRADKIARKTGGGEVERPESLTPFTKLSPEQMALVIGPEATAPGTLTEPRDFNLMFQTYVGALQSEDAKAYLRPETAQGQFLNFKNIVDTTRVKIPFGIAQVGKSFRNEVTPRNFIFRSREFEQMEMEWFCHPDESKKWYEFWKAERMKWWRSLGVAESRLRFRDHEQDELSHYSKMTVDIEYLYPFTAPDFGELEGIAHRGCYDLTQHQTHSGAKLDYFDQELQLKLKEQGASPEEIKEKSRYLPNVIEPASGLTRAVLVLLCEAYAEDATRPSPVYMKFDPKMAPIKAGIFPLVNKDGMPEAAEKLYMDLRTRFMCEYDPKQSIGKRYARMDEIGTPYCITIDGDTITNQTVTIRERDSLKQDRIAIDQVKQYLTDRLL
ncbi:MAG TPA: glycine--tRNA ligase [Tepidisphaeraceae bacterium]|jgi:glycyl-tRNA synthetase|nr:glycine--tRNA ligase [Tepidisphaeraceae bacterium]